MKIDKNFYPGWVRKAITFTIDDGNLSLDKKFIDIVKPYGIKGTFNFPGLYLDRSTSEEYRSLYRGFGIANHCKVHPFAFADTEEYAISEEPFSQDSDASYLYKTDRNGVYHINTPRGWRIIADTEGYLCCIDDAQEEIDSVFGKGVCRSFVWPFCEQNNARVKDYLKLQGYRSVRKTGATKDTTGFAVPSDRMAWSYNADHGCLTAVAELYDRYEDDGELKFFAFGVHSHDFENNNCWYILEDFAKKYGNRHNEFWYATVDAIFDYADAVNALVITDTEIVNDTEISLYLKVNGERVVLSPFSKYEL
jgi:peptidoglycan/xylan/chitin deacetylase (PgdA/CDA1 family)